MVLPMRKYLQVKCSWKGLMLNANVTRTAWICSNSCASLKSLFLFADLLHIPQEKVYKVSNQKDALLYIFIYII